MFGRPFTFTVNTVGALGQAPVVAVQVNVNDVTPKVAVFTVNDVELLATMPPAGDVTNVRPEPVGQVYLPTNRAF